MKSLLKYTGYQARLTYGYGHFGYWLGDGLDINGLKVFFVETRTRCLTSNTQNWNRISNRRVKASDHIGSSRA